jgi:hypothetical protein
MSLGSSPLDHAFIDFCDRDSNWGPLLFLRPQRTEPIGWARCIAGATLLGLPLGIIGSIMMVLFARLVQRPEPTLMYFPAILIVAYWIVGSVTLVRAWNHRAARLARFQRY